VWIVLAGKPLRRKRDRKPVDKEYFKPTERKINRELQNLLPRCISKTASVYFTEKPAKPQIKQEERFGLWQPAQSKRKLKLTQTTRIYKLNNLREVVV
jgi:hypothetical protein